MKRILALLIILLPIISLAQRVEISPYQYRRASLFEQLKIGKKDIVFLGNSIADEAELAEMFDNTKVKNRTISGERIENLLDRLEPILEGKPKKVFLMIGIDGMIYDNDTVENTLWGVEIIIDKFARESPKTKLYVQSILPVGEKLGDSKERIKSLCQQICNINQKLEMMCIEKGVEYIDLHSEMVNEQGIMKTKYSNDGVHLMGDGYMIWRETIKKYVN